MTQDGIWVGVATPRDGLVHACEVTGVDAETLIWHCPAHVHGIHSRKYVDVWKTNCVFCLVAWTPGQKGESRTCHHIE